MKILLTGGHSGMGLELSKKLLKEGHQIGLILRSEKRRSDAILALGAVENVDFFIADLSKREEVEKVANEIKSKWDKIDGLFNNAGVLLDKLYYADSGVELHLEINGISPYLLTKALKPLLDKSDSPFVVNTATAGLDSRKSIDIEDFKKPKKFAKLTGSYMDSKLIMVLLMNYLDKQWTNVRFVSLNPGAIKTKMTSGSGMPSWLLPIRNLLFLSPERGALSLHNAAFSDRYKGSGIYINNKKIRSLKYEVSKSEIDQLLATN
jgi:NAD(P)-dependent dehydrogenase (short-subunit alcohol dehydrogenase family)